MIASRNPDAFGVSGGQERELYTLIPPALRDSPDEALSRLIAMSQAITSVLGSEGCDIFENKDAMLGFYFFSDAISRGLGDLSHQMHDHLHAVQYHIFERDKARAEAKSLRRRLAGYELIRNRYTEEIDRMAADVTAIVMPDLSEPVGGAEDGIEDPGDPAARAG